MQLNELSSKQKTNEQEEERMNQNKESKQKIIDGLSTQVSTLLQTTQAKTEHLDRLHEQIAERETNHSKRQAIQNEMEERKIRLASHRERVEEKRIELEEAEKTLHANKEKLSDVQKKHADLDQEIASGQKEEQEVVAPARKEFPKLLKESEELSRLIAKYREVLTSLKKSAEADLSSKKAILEDVKKQIQEKSNDEQEKEARLASLRESREIANKNALEEIEQQNSLKSKFEEAMSTEAAVIQALKEQREREHDKRMEVRRHDFLAEEYKRDLLACGADIIQETKQTEDKYENLPIEA
jgi:chromosome segregation ATPase